MHLTSWHEVIYLLLFVVLILDLCRCDDGCKFYETLVSTQNGDNAFDVKLIVGHTENTSVIVQGSDQTTTLNGNAHYRIKFEPDNLYRTIKVCVTSNIDRVIFNVYGHNDERHVKRVENPVFPAGAMQMCFVDFDAIADQVGPIQRIVIRLKPRTTNYYNVTDLLVEACTGERVCGWSQYADAGIEGGSLPSNSIVGGWQARPNEFPWQALLFVESSFICGGSVIDSLYVLTAAHCTFGKNASDIVVILGNEQLGELSINQLSFTVEEVINHEYYKDNSPYNDIALLRLSVEIPSWTNAIQPICLSQRPTRHLVGVEMTISGWGYTAEGGSISNDLMYATGLPVMSFYECEKCQNDHSGSDIVFDGMMCAGVCGSNGRDSCQGDSGGPLAYKSPDGAWELVGIVSWGFGCASTTPGVYSDVYFYKEWIQENTPMATLPFFV